MVGKLKSSTSERFVKLPLDVLKCAAMRVLDLNEQVAERFFDSGQRLAFVVEETPIYPLLEFQQTFSRKAFEYYVRGARLLIGAL